VGHYPNTALFILTPPQKKSLEQGSGLSSLGRIIRTHKVVSCVSRVCPPVFGKSGFRARCPVDRSWCAQRCCDGAATESLLRRSRCCDGYAQTSSFALILRVASS